MVQEFKMWRMFFMDILHEMEIPDGWQGIYKWYFYLRSYVS
jgi:hypothetical protein